MGDYIPSSDIIVVTSAVIGHVGANTILVVIAKEAVVGFVVIGLRMSTVVV